MTTLTIGQLAKQTDTAVATLRYYEREGLLPTPRRSASGYRHYDPAIVQRVHFIQRAKQLGFSLREIRELLVLSTDPETTCAQVRERADSKIADIDARIQDLRAMRSALVGLASNCAAEGPASECPILAALEEQGESTLT